MGAHLDLDQPVHSVWSESSLDTFWIYKDEKFLNRDNEDWSNCIGAHTDESSLGTCQKVHFLLLPLHYLYIPCLLTLVLLNLDMPGLCNSLNPDQLASEANWSGSTLFVIR